VADALNRILREAADMKNKVVRGKYGEAGIEDVYERVARAVEEGGEDMDGAPVVVSCNAYHTLVPYHHDAPGVVFEMEPGSTGGGGTVCPEYLPKP
jgi:hypothetical protein